MMTRRDSVSRKPQSRDDQNVVHMFNQKGSCWMLTHRLIRLCTSFWVCRTSRLNFVTPDLKSVKVATSSWLFVPECHWRLLGTV